MVIVLVPEGEPASSRTLCPPSDSAPSVVVSVVVVPVKDKDSTPLIARSIMSKFELVVVPQVPACSPDAGFSMPMLAVYEDAI